MDDEKRIDNAEPEAPEKDEQDPAGTGEDWDEADQERERLGEEKTDPGAPPA